MISTRLDESTDRKCLRGETRLENYLYVEKTGIPPKAGKVAYLDSKVILNYVGVLSEQKNLPYGVFFLG